MPAAGQYTVRFLWLKCVSEDDETGDGVESHVPNGHLWVACDDQSGLRGDDAGAVQTGAQAQIRIRNYPAVSTLDLLHDEFNGLVYHIDSIIIGDNELICDCYRNDELVNFTIEDS